MSTPEQGTQHDAHVRATEAVRSASWRLIARRDSDERLAREGARQRRTRKRTR